MRCVNTNLDAFTHIKMSHLSSIVWWFCSNHEGKRAGVDVGMVNTAVNLVGIVPVGRAVMFMAEPFGF